MMLGPLLVRDRHTPRQAGSHERGSATIQMVVLMPALFALMFLGVQAALLFQGRTIVLAAAQEGARVAATENSTAGAGSAAATSFLNSTTAGLSNFHVAANRNAADARVTVQANTVSVIPGWSPLIVQSASMPVERVTG